MIRGAGPGQDFYITGGTLPRDAPSYILRAADTQLFEGLLSGRFCYVLTSRQMGKSSLMVRTAGRLRQAGVTCAVLDLTAIGQDLTREQWYDGLQNALGRQLNLEDELERFWLSHARFSPLQRWMLALEEVVLPRIPGPVVLFLDEIDAVRSLPFAADEFFAAIREFYNRRVECPALERLTFCLLGVASPSDLIRDTRTTPFNVGQRIDLTDFTLEEAEPLTAGFMQDRAPAAARRLLGRILHWTGGHPYLTQRLCQAVAANACLSYVKTGADGAVSLDETVDNICARLLVSPQARVQNDNLLFVRDRLLRSEVDIPGLLALYGSIYRGRSVPDDEADPRVTVLRLSGITRTENGFLRVRNRIYARVFDRDWIAASMPDAEIRRQRAAFRRGAFRTGFLAGGVILTLSALGVTAMREAETARRATRISRQYASRMNTARQQADTARRDALAEARKAREAERNLLKALRKAEEQRIDAERQKRLATRRQAEAESARRETVEKLRDSYLVQAQASRWSGRAGHKFNSLAALERAARLPASAEFRLQLRNEAIASMALPIDLRLISRRRYGSFNSVALSIDEQADRFACREEPGMITVRGVKSGSRLMRLSAPPGVLRNTRFSPSGRFLAATFSEPLSMRVWDLERREIVWVPKNVAKISTSAFVPGARRTLLYGMKDGSVRERDLLSGADKMLCSLRDGQPYLLRISPDGKRLAYRLMDEMRQFKVLDLASRTITAVTVPEEIGAMTWSPDGTHLAIGQGAGTIQVWNVREKRVVAQMSGHLSLPTKLVFLRGGRLLASSGWDNSLRFWDVRSGRQVLKVDQAYLYQFGQDERHLFVVGEGVIQTFEVDAGQECRTVQHEPGRNTNTTDFLPGSSLLVTAADDGVRFWDAENGSERAFLRTGFKSHALLTPDSRYLALYEGNSRTLSVRRLRVSARGASVVVGAPVARRRIPDMEALNQSPDGRQLICVNDKSLVLVSLPGLQDRVVLDPHPDVTGVELSPDSRWAVSSGHHAMNVKVWNARTGRHSREIAAGKLNAATFSPDGRWLVTGNPFGYRFWRTDKWRPEREIPRAPGVGLPGFSAFAPDMSLVALAHSQSVFDLLEPETGRHIARLAGPTETLLTDEVKFSPDNAYLVTGTESGVFYLWDLRRIRARLARMGLDWNLPPPPPASRTRAPLRVRIEPSPAS